MQAKPSLSIQKGSPDAPKWDMQIAGLIHDQQLVNMASFHSYLYLGQSVRRWEQHLHLPINCRERKSLLLHPIIYCVLWATQYFNIDTYSVQMWLFGSCCHLHRGQIRCLLLLASFSFLLAANINTISMCMFFFFNLLPCSLFALHPAGVGAERKELKLSHAPQKYIQEQAE